MHSTHQSKLPSSPPVNGQFYRQPKPGHVTPWSKTRRRRAARHIKKAAALIAKVEARQARAS